MRTNLVSTPSVQSRREHRHAVAAFFYAKTGMRETNIGTVAFFYWKFGGKSQAIVKMARVTCFKIQCRLYKFAVTKYTIDFFNTARLKLFREIAMCSFGFRYHHQ